MKIPTPAYSLIIFQTAYDYTDYINSGTHDKKEAIKTFITKLQDLLEDMEND